MLVAGPPCLPCGKMGNRNLFADYRTHVAWHIMAVIGHCAATQAGFGCFVLENVTGMLGGPRRLAEEFFEEAAPRSRDSGARRVAWSHGMELRVHQLDAKDVGL